MSWTDGDECVGCGQPLENHCLGFGTCNHKCTNQRASSRDAALRRDGGRREPSATERLANGFLMLSLAYE